jgi:hypothetical protein
MTDTGHRNRLSTCFEKQDRFGSFAMNSAPCGFRRTQPLAIVQAVPEFSWASSENNLWEE